MSTTKDPWVHVLQQLEPMYFKWKDIVDNGPKIHADLSQQGRWWCITLQEESLPKTDLSVKWTNIGKLDERVAWAKDQLKEWPDVKRMAHDMWYFKYRKDAEKFITLFHLSWDR